MQAGDVLIDPTCKDWQAWYRVKVVNVDLFGNVTVVPTREDKVYKPYIYPPAEAKKLKKEE